MSSNDLEGEHVSLGGDIRLLLLGPRDLCFESPADIFPQGVEKRELQLWIVSCYSSPDPYHFAKILEL